MGTKRRKVKYNRAGATRSGKSYTGTAKRSSRRGRSRTNMLSIKRLPLWAFALIVIAAGIAVFLVGRTAFFYVTESGVDPDNPYPVKGIDVSVFQLDINWEGIKDEDIAFAFIKATEGSTHVDKNFKTNWEGAHDAGIATGAYHFLSYDSDAYKQADNYINTVPKKWGALPPVVDVEFYGDYSSNAPSAELLQGKLNVVLQRLENHYHKTPIIYTNGHIYSKYISGNYDKYPIWISDPEMSEKLSDGRDWTFCQYTFKGYSTNVAGGEKYVDFNVFNGTKWEFRKFR